MREPLARRRSVLRHSQLVGSLLGWPGNRRHRQRWLLIVRILSLVCLVGLASLTNAQTAKIDDGAPRPIITTIAGGEPPPLLGVGGPATEAQFLDPWNIAVDSKGNVFVVDRLYRSVLKIDADDGTLGVLAGNGIIAFSGDGGPADRAAMLQPRGIAVDSDDNVLIADRGAGAGGRIRKVSCDEDGENCTIDTVVGGCTENCCDYLTSSQCSATEVDLGLPWDVAVGPNDVLYILVDRGSKPWEILRVSQGDLSSLGEFPGASAIAVDSEDNIYVATQGTRWMIFKFRHDDLVPPECNTTETPRNLRFGVIPDGPMGMDPLPEVPPELVP